MMCDKCENKRANMTFDFTQGGKNPKGKIEHICSDCYLNMIRRYRND